MSTLVDQAVEALRKVAPSEQEEIARAVLRLIGHQDGVVVALSPDERAAIARSKKAASSGDFASDAEVEAVWAKRGL